jgi:hypothetical protein
MNRTFVIILIYFYYCLNTPMLILKYNIHTKKKTKDFQRRTHTCNALCS